MILAVEIELHGVPVEARSVRVFDMVRLGDAPDAVVSFPGADVRVFERDGALWTRGRVLRPGDRLVLNLGAVTVKLQALKASRVEPLRPTLEGRVVPSWAPEPRAMMMCAAAVVCSLWAETLWNFTDRHPEVLEPIAAVWRAEGGSDGSVVAGFAREVPPAMAPELDLTLPLAVDEPARLPCVTRVLAGDAEPDAVRYVDVRAPGALCLPASPSTQAHSTPSP